MFKFKFKVVFLVFLIVFAQTAPASFAIAENVNSESQNISTDSANLLIKDEEKLEEEEPDLAKDSSNQAVEPIAESTSSAKMKSEEKINLASESAEAAFSNEEEQESASDSAELDEVVSGNNTNNQFEDQNSHGDDRGSATYESDSSISSKGHTPEDATESAVVTGDATASATLTNEVNTNIVAEEYLMSVYDHFDNSDEEIDFSQYEIKCITKEKWLEGDFSSSETIYINNNANLVNDIKLSADSGGNTSTGNISTGDATAKTNLFNMVNTNLVGDCWYFGVFNIYDDYSGNIILPYESQFVELPLMSQLDIPTSSQSAEYKSRLKTVNSADIDEDIASSTNTGDNSSIAGDVKAGSAENSVQTIDKINTNYFGSNWLLVEIMNPQYWQGKFEGIEPNNSYYGDSLFYWLPPTENTQQADTVEKFEFESDISISNTANVSTKIDSSTNTGRNSSSEGRITTGNAISKVNISNFINTNIVGNNWYYVALNLFDDFTGNVVFPRSELGLNLSTDKSKVSPGETILVTAQVTNSGKVSARDNTITLRIPSGFSIVESSMGAVYSDNEVRWKISDLQSKSWDVRQLLLKADDSHFRPGKIKIFGNASTRTQEQDLENNIGSIGLQWFLPNIGGVAHESNQNLANIDGDVNSPEDFLVQEPKFIFKTQHPESLWEIVNPSVLASSFNQAQDKQPFIDNEENVDEKLMSMAVNQVEQHSGNQFADKSADESYWQELYLWFRSLYSYIINLIIN